MGKRVAKSAVDGVDAVTTKWTHIFFGRDNMPVIHTVDSYFYIIK